jgi:hypothetical protein
VENTVKKKKSKIESEDEKNLWKTFVLNTTLPFSEVETTICEIREFSESSLACEQSVPRLFF